MLPKIGRIILYCILTAIIAISVWQLKELPLSSDRNIFKIISYVLAFLMLPLAFWQWKKIRPYKKRTWMSENPAEFSSDMIDCYVRFTGKITSEKAHRLPLSSSECVFYIASVVAEWQTKAKKPSKGMETQRKPLLREQSADELMLEGSDGPVYVKVEDFSANWLELRKREKTQANCPSRLAGKAESKYTTYRLLERYLEHGDKVAAQGRLSRNTDGRLFIKPTKRLEYPSFFAVETELAQLTNTIADKSNHDAWVKRINVGFLLINALVFCLLWH
ncbi:MAG: hypothetical protein CDV28_11245 [Candidatus Electronema aureum]|uniref:Uncharacterized protein n=1 Tax=Candidatus Electronema aureum TaxID=2005002 RepID=A0A521G2J6_9BACT|nr:MAG: hypothetical protein CDV28_11245 [Candidatus Electronema aureum]